MERRAGSSPCKLAAVIYPEKMNQHSERSTYHVKEWHAIEAEGWRMGMSMRMPEMMMRRWSWLRLHKDKDIQWAMHRKRLLNQSEN